MSYLADLGARAGQGVGLPLLDCWDSGLESRPGHGCSPVVSVVCCVASGFCDELITRSEEFCRVWCVCVCVCV
jgi:hypothetical protein